jgi:hypothetical protein
MLMAARLMTALFLLAFAPVAAVAQECLHGTNSSDEQKARKRAALTAARQVNTLQANGSIANKGKYLTQVQMSELYAEQVKLRHSAAPLVFDRSGEIVPGFRLTFDLTDRGYWFMIKDATDPCGFAYISNENGVIYAAEPIR